MEIKEEETVVPTSEPDVAEEHEEEHVVEEQEPEWQKVAKFIAKVIFNCFKCMKLLSDG